MHSGRVLPGHGQPAVRLSRVGVLLEENHGSRRLLFGRCAETALAFLERFNVFRIAVAHRLCADCYRKYAQNDCREAPHASLYWRLVAKLGDRTAAGDVSARSRGRRIPWTGRASLRVDWPRDDALGRLDHSASRWRAVVRNAPAALLDDRGRAANPPAGRVGRPAAGSAAQRRFPGVLFPADEPRILFAPG